MDTYVYGVLRAAEKAPAFDRGIDDQQVELVASGELAALVSDAPTVPVRANRRNLIAHSHVLQQAVGERCVLPMRFGVVMPSRDTVVAELLEARADQLRDQLDAFDPYVELDLRALCPEDELLRSVVAERPEIARLREALGDRPVESTYYERIRLGELVAEAVGEKRAAVARRVADALEPLAAAAQPGDSLHEAMLANVAFLVERGRIGEFDGAVERLGSELGPQVRLRYTGPLPPHHFVDVEEGAWA